MNAYRMSFIHRLDPNLRPGSLRQKLDLLLLVENFCDLCTLTTKDSNKKLELTTKVRKRGFIVMVFTSDLSENSELYVRMLLLIIL